MKKQTLFILIFFSIICSIHSQNNIPFQLSDTLFNNSKIPIDPAVKIGKLPNGLTYYIRQNKKPENKVELRLIVNAGSILEEEDQLGLAHFMEHMSFNGTKNFKKNELLNYLQSIGLGIGADLNAQTGFDETIYNLSILSDDDAKLEKGFQILEDWAHSVLLTETDIDEERGVVLEELRLRNGASSRVFKKYLSVLMHGSKYADRIPIGNENTLKTFNYEALRRFYRDWYRPHLMAIVAVGDKDIPTLEQKIKDHFTHIPVQANPKVRETFAPENHEETLILIEGDEELSFSKVELIYKDDDETSPQKTINDYRKYIVKLLLIEILNNRFIDLTNNKAYPFLYEYSFQEETLARKKNTWKLIIETDPNKQLQGLQTLLDESERLQRYGVVDSEFERAKKNLTAIADKAFNDKDKEESVKLVEQYVNHFLQQEPIPGIEWEYKNFKKILSSVKIEEINKTINHYLHDDNRVVVVIGPKKIITEDEVIETLNNIKKKDLKPYEDKVVTSTLITKPIQAGSIISTETNDQLGITRLTLSNGAKVTYKKTDFKNDEILFQAFSFGGLSLLSNEELEATELAYEGLFDAGINGLSESDIFKILSDKILNLSFYITELSEWFSGISTTNSIEELFQLVHLFFTSLNKDHDLFNSYIDRQKNFLNNLTGSPDFFFRKEMKHFLNNGNQRFFGLPSIEAYEKQDYNLAYEKYLERVADAGDFNFYFVGSINEDQIKEFSEKYLASLPSKNSNENFKIHDFRPLSGAHSKTVVKGKESKSYVLIIYQGETNYDEKEALCFTILGDIINIKLTERLREKEGDVYFSNGTGMIEQLPFGKYQMVISFQCAPENVEKLKKMSIDLVKNIVENGPIDDDLIKIQKKMIHNYKENLKNNRFWLSSLVNLDFKKISNSDLHSFNYEEVVNSISTEDLQRVAQKYLINDYIIGILNPEN